MSRSARLSNASTATAEAQANIGTYPPNTFVMRMATNGPTPVANACIIEKYPMPSPYRARGMTSAAPAAAPA